MRRIFHLVLACSMVLMPLQALAESKRDAADSGASTKKKHKKARRGSEEEQAAEAARSQRHRRKARPRVVAAEAPPADAPAAEPAPVAPPAAEPAEENEDGEVISPALEAWNQRLPPRRYAYIIGGLLGITGLIFTFHGQVEAKRAETLPGAADTQRAYQSAQTSTATSYVMYGTAAAAVVIALVLEFLPDPVAEKASLTFHF